MINVQCLGLMPYNAAWQLQQELVRQVLADKIGNQLLLLEHPHTITLGRGSNSEHILTSAESLNRVGIEVAEIDRGGDVTYHGPGQLIGYPIFKIERAKVDPHQYLRALEEVLIEALNELGFKAQRDPKYTGVWIDEQKVAAIGVKFNRGPAGYVTSHGFALNVNTDLSFFKYIVPCGISEYGVTSLAELREERIDIVNVEQPIIKSFQKKFGVCLS